MKKRDIIEQVQKIILRHITPNRIYLFGSQINGEAGERSDIDMAYDSADKSHDLMIKEEVEQLPTLIKVDVINLATAGERFRQRVMCTGRVVWSATKLLRMEDGLINLRSALTRYNETITHQDDYIRDGYGDIFLDIAVKRFEFTFEMAWKACKRSLDYLGFACKSPRECLREAYSQNIINEEAVWLEMLEQRNLSAHVYDEISVSEIKQDLVRYLAAFEMLEQTLTLLYQKENEKVIK